MSYLGLSVVYSGVFRLGSLGFGEEFFRDGGGGEKVRRVRLRLGWVIEWGGREKVKGEREWEGRRWGVEGEMGKGGGEEEVGVGGGNNVGNSSY